MVPRLLLVLLCSLITLSGCSKPELNYLAPNATILAFGDSLTVGKGTSSDNSYPAVLQLLTGRQVINAGISGELSNEGLARLPSLLDQHAPQLVILLEGGNDILQNRNRDSLKQNLAAMIELIQARNIQLVFLGVPEKKLFSDSAPLYPQLAEQYELVFDGNTVAELLRSPEYKSDPVHLNQQGYYRLAEQIQLILQQHNAL